MASPTRSHGNLPEQLSPGTLRAVIRARTQAQLKAHAQAPTHSPRRPTTATNGAHRPPSHKSALRRRPRNTSYRELSSSDEHSEIDMSEEESSISDAAAASPSQRREPRRSARQRTSIVQQPPVSQSRQRQSQRRSSRLVSYADDSHSDSLMDEEQEAAEEEEGEEEQESNIIDQVLQAPSPKRQRISNPNSGADTSSRTTRSSKKLPSRRKVVQFQERKPSPKLSAPNVPSDGVIPPWQSLPYDILLSIFRYALYPAHDNNFRPTPNVNWLLRASRTCKAFTEPALSALYDSPPLLFKDQPHDFLDLVAREETLLNYKLKVKRLDLDYRRTLAYSAPGRGFLDITALIAGLPNLAALDISTGLDRPPYRQITQKGRWVYPESLFQCLVDTGTHLREWRWAGHMIGKAFPGFHELHLQPPFQSLTHLTLSHLWFTDVGDETKKSKTEMLPFALQALGNLENLTLVACDSFRWEIMDSLPNDLRSLEIINCSTFDTQTLDEYIKGHGKRLRKVVLNHNHALDLSWLVNLKTCCPNLEILRMDLTYFSTALLTRNADAEPVYDTLMSPHDTPTWPATLVELEMLNLRKWTSEAAVALFESILSSSKELTHLRRLVIRAMIDDISWRERAGFREKWIGRLRDTFLSQSPPPNPHLASFRTHREWKEATQRQEKEREEKEEARKGESDRRRTRSAQHAQDDRDGTNSEEEREGGNGHCDVVEINIDNMRPTEIRLSEADFMDSEISGDEEWTGERSSPGRNSYAW